VLRIAVVGATGAVGRECLRLIDQGAAPPTDRVYPVASPASAGRDLRAECGLSVAMDPVTALDRLDLTAIDVAIFCAGAALSRQEVERVAAAGVLVVDNSSAFRMRPDVPLVVPQVNPHLLERRPAAGIVANPNCSTIQLVRALHPLHVLAGLEQVVVATYQAASGGGQRGLAELAADSGRVLSDPGGPVEAAGRFGHPLAFNLVPQIGPVDDAGISHEERKLAREPRRILDLPELRVSATAVRVPVPHCHSMAAYLRLRTPVSAALVENTLAVTPGIRIYRRHHHPSYPMPRLLVGDEDRALVHVGRVRGDPDDARAAWLWIVADNLWVGAALNALEIVGLAVKYGWLG
jgi:aspartate-semialdehyde dehydrogenase